MSTIQTNTSVSLDDFCGHLDEQLRENELDVPVLPKIANDILLMSEDRDTDMGDLSQLIHRDQSIAGKVLQIANSAAFASSERIVSLQQAVARLGMQLLSEIALSIAVKSNVFKSDRHQTTIKLLWRHSLASALYGKEVARFLRKNVEGQYLCGLLHAIGKPVAVKSIESFETQNDSFLDEGSLCELVEEYHIPIGTFVTAEWDLPRTVQVANEFYRDYSEAPEFKNETAITYLADLLATHLVYPDRVDDKTLLHDPVFEALNIYPDDRITILKKQETIAALVSSMDI